MRRKSLLIGLLVVACIVLGGPVAAQVSDVFKVPTVTAPGTGTLRVPVYVRDNPGTPIGTDQLSDDKKITNIAFQVVYGPIGCATTVAPYVDRTGGILDGTATIIGEPHVANTSQSFIFTRVVNDGLIPFTGNDDKIAEIVFSLNGCAVGTVIPLVFNSALTALGSQDNTNEDPVNGWLSVVNGSITVEAGPPPTPTPTVTPTPTPPPCVKGDVNGDGVVDAADVRYLRKFVGGRGPAPVCSGDVNGDGQVDGADVRYLQKYVQGKGPAPV